MDDYILFKYLAEMSVHYSGKIPDEYPAIKKELSKLIDYVYMKIKERDNDDWEFGEPPKQAPVPEPSDAKIWWRLKPYTKQTGNVRIKRKKKGYAHQNTHLYLESLNRDIAAGK